MKLNPYKIKYWKTKLNFFKNIDLKTKISTLWDGAQKKKKTTSINVLLSSHSNFKNKTKYNQ
jgi:hypothetical protein